MSVLIAFPVFYLDCVEGCMRKHNYCEVSNILRVTSLLLSSNI